eukprot:TRINITY_DN46205_c0_g1_i1.p1 TRINITY_DN46205_c0_g1~~TRINITY_DN46205_c0_g1_i1.p1  ORF type:complete len:360 (-),score=34.18 TRINITY_DN46205_c0_g1_i1:36-1079(-)
MTARSFTSMPVTLKLQGLRETGQISKPNSRPFLVRRCGLRTAIESCKKNQTCVETEGGKNWVELSSRFDLDFGEVLGRGSFGVIRRVVRRDDCSQIGHQESRSDSNKAAKCLYAGDDEIRELIRREYKVMASLKHNAIVRAEGLYEQGDNIIILMELCADGSVQSYVDAHGSFSEQIGRGHCRQFLEGLSYLHQQGFVHRDIKPANLLLTGRPQVLKIGDFGSVSTALSTDEPAHMLLSARGTLMFSAPELLFGKFGTQKVDVWAYGFSCYFMLKAKLPFKAQSQKVRAGLVIGQLPPISFKGLSTSVHHFLELCLTVDEAMRPPADELLSHSLWSDSFDISVCPPS